MGVEGNNKKEIYATVLVLWSFQGVKVDAEGRQVAPLFKWRLPTPRPLADATFASHENSISRKFNKKKVKFNFSYFLEIYFWKINLMKFNLKNYKKKINLPRIF